MTILRYSPRFDDASIDATTLAMQGREVRRYDTLNLLPPERTASGFLRVEGNLTRSGVFTYKTTAGEIRRELRPPSVVFHAEYLRTFDMAPVTIDHPMINGELVDLDPSNVQQFQVGNASLPIPAPPWVTVELLITAQKAIDVLDSGKRGLSAGYTALIVDRPGVYVDEDGREEPFDAIHVAFVGNHVAIVDLGRAGPEARLRLDQADAWLIENKKPALDRTTKEDEMETVEITVNGKTFKVPVEVAEGMQRRDAQIVELTGQQSTLEGTVAALKSEKAKAEEAAQAAQRADSDNERINERLELVARAAPVLKLEIKEVLKFDDAKIRSDVVAKLAPDVKLEGRDAGFITGVFETVMASRKVDTAEAISNLAKDTPPKPAPTARKRADDARAAMLDRNKDRWKAKTTQ